MEKISTFEELLQAKYGSKGSKKRDQFDRESIAFRLGEQLKAARKEAKLSQEQLAERTGTKKSYISRIERGMSDIQFSTFFKLVEIGLQRRLLVEIV
jgi:ribosome-binding protein aMBF1 (putative translation factor)